MTLILGNINAAQRLTMLAIGVDFEDADRVAKATYEKYASIWWKGDEGEMHVTCAHPGVALRSTFDVAVFSHGLSSHMGQGSLDAYVSVVCRTRLKRVNGVISGVSCVEEMPTAYDYGEKAWVPTSAEAQEMNTVRVRSDAPFHPLHDVGDLVHVGDMSAPLCQVVGRNDEKHTRRLKQRLPHRPGTLAAHAADLLPATPEEMVAYFNESTSPVFMMASPSPEALETLKAHITAQSSAPRYAVMMDSADFASDRQLDANIKHKLKLLVDDPVLTIEKKADGQPETPFAKFDAGTPWPAPWKPAPDGKAYAINPPVTAVFTNPAVYDSMVRAESAEDLLGDPPPSFMESNDCLDADVDKGPIGEQVDCGTFGGTRHKLAPAEVNLDIDVGVEDNGDLHIMLRATTPIVLTRAMLAEMGVRTETDIEAALRELKDAGFRRADGALLGPDDDAISAIREKLGLPRPLDPAEAAKGSTDGEYAYARQFQQQPRFAKKHEPKAGDVVMHTGGAFHPGPWCVEGEVTETKYTDPAVDLVRFDDSAQVERATCRADHVRPATHDEVQKSHDRFPGYTLKIDRGVVVAEKQKVSFDIGTKVLVKGRRSAYEVVETPMCRGLTDIGWRKVFDLSSPEGVRQTCMVNDLSDLETITYRPDEAWIIDGWILEGVSLRIAHALNLTHGWYEEDDYQVGWSAFKDEGVDMTLKLSGQKAMELDVRLKGIEWDEVDDDVMQASFTLPEARLLLDFIHSEDPTAWDQYQADLAAVGANRRAAEAEAASRSDCDPVTCNDKSCPNAHF